MSTRRKGFGFGERYGRDDDDRAPPPEQPLPAVEPPMVPYVPFRCPKCGDRFPDHRGSGRGRYPVHYLRCKACNLQYRAQELDGPEFRRLVDRDGGG